MKLNASEINSDCRTWLNVTKSIDRVWRRLQACYVRDRIHQMQVVLNKCSMLESP